MTSDPKAAPTQRIGRYDIIGEIGRGGMGIVYRGEDKLIGRDVAIKTLTEVTPELRERFYVEARSGILSHPNIVTVYELGEHEGSPFIAMEFLSGDSLEKMLRLRRRLPVLETLLIVEQICAGLAYAHQHGLLHRDVKPANMIVLPDGRVKIVDFGIARLADQTTRLTKTDALLGTFHYIAPERLKGELSDGRADIWSLGVMLYEMVTGELPFRGKDVSALYRVINEPYVPLAELVSDVPQALSMVLDRALAKDVDERYATAEEMAFDLQLVGDGLKIERVQELVESARRLTEERHFAGARTVLLQAQRIDPSHADVRLLMQDVQDQIGHLQRGEQLRQVVEQAGDAVESKRYDEAIAFYEQAAKLDLENTCGLTERIEAARASKEQAQRVRTLWDQANEARSRGDLTMAEELLGQAVRIDEKSTDLRNAHSIVLREVRHRDQGRRVEKLLQRAREEYSGRRYTEMIVCLREAAEIDPTHSEVQQLLLTATARQKEERRRLMLEQLVAGISESLSAEDFGRAQDRITRALESLPHEPLLLRLRTEIEEKKQAFDAAQLVRAAMLEAQQIAADDPRAARSIIQSALEQVPRDTTLLQFLSRLEEHLERMAKDELHVRQLGEAQAHLEAGRFDDAIRGLESALIELDVSEEMQSLLSYARSAQQKTAQRAEHDAIWQQAQSLQDAAKWQTLARYLEPILAKQEDAALASMLEDARRRLRETATRVENVRNRVSELAEKNADEALQLLADQPPEILSDDELSALRDKVVQRVVLRRALAAASAQSRQLLASSDLSSSLDGFEDVSRIYGDSAELEQARAACEKDRLAAADAALQKSMNVAREALQADERKRALQDLRRNKDIATFASEPVRAAWQAMQAESDGFSPKKKQASRQTAGKAENSDVVDHAEAGVRKPSIASAAKRRSKVSLFGVLGATLLAFAAFGRRHIHHAPAPLPASPTIPIAPAIPLTYMEINASPWARVVKITDAHGKNVQLDDVDAVTPLRVAAIAAEEYVVTFEDAEGRQQVVHCSVTPSQHACSADLGTPDVRQVLAGEQP
jgi:eukaryotic-like serine/threonine-protein kinase